MREYLVYGDKSWNIARTTQFDATLLAILVIGNYNGNNFTHVHSFKWGELQE